MSDWPDPTRPGVPLNPERDGWHWMKGNIGKLIAAQYFAAKENGWPERPTWLRDNVRFCHYLGPVLTPDETAALEARIAGLESALRRIIGTLDDPTGGQHVADMRAASSVAIAALAGGKKDA